MRPLVGDWIMVLWWQPTLPVVHQGGTIMSDRRGSNSDFESWSVGRRLGKNRDQRDDSDPYGGNYWIARRGALMRSKFVCQLCGGEKASEGHHWALEYPAGKDVVADDLTALCRQCHNYATIVRRVVEKGANRRALDSMFREVVDERDDWRSAQGWPRSKSSRAKLEEKNSQLGCVMVALVVETVFLLYVLSGGFPG